MDGLVGSIRGGIAFTPAGLALAGLVPVTAGRHSNITAVLAGISLTSCHYFNQSAGRPRYGRYILIVRGGVNRHFRHSLSALRACEKIFIAHLPGEVTTGPTDRT